MANRFPKSDEQQCFTIPDAGHWVVAQICFSHQSLSNVPHRFQVCDVVAVSCCDTVSAERTQTLVNGTLSSTLQPGTWLSGQFSFSVSEGTPDTSCDQIIQDAQCLITQVVPQVQPSPRRKGPKKRPREEEIPCDTVSALTQDSSAALDGKEGNVRPNSASDTKTEQQDKTIAASIIKKLINGIKAVRTEGNSPDHEKQYDTPQTVSIEIVKWTDSINQLGMNLWHHSDKVEQAATHIVHQDRLLSSYCRLYLKAVQEPLHYDQDPSKQETQRRHEDAVSLLSLVVNGLYEYRQSLALVLYNAVCKKRFLLSGSTKVSSARRSRIAKLVVDGLRYEPIAIAEDSTVLHPGVFLKYHKQSLQLPDICAALGLSNLKGLSLSDEEIGKYWSGVPIRLFARQDANKFITCYDEKHGLNLITDCAINGAGTVQPVSTQSPEDVGQNHHTQQYDGRREEVGTNSAVDVQRPSTNNMRSDDDMGYVSLQEFGSNETPIFFEPSANPACDGLFLEEHSLSDLDQVLSDSNMINCVNGFIGFPPSNNE